MRLMLSLLTALKVLLRLLLRLQRLLNMLTALKVLLRLLLRLQRCLLRMLSMPPSPNPLLFIILLPLSMSGVTLPLNLLLLSIALLLLLPNIALLQFSIALLLLSIALLLLLSIAVLLAIISLYSSLSFNSVHPESFTIPCSRPVTSDLETRRGLLLNSATTKRATRVSLTGCSIVPA